MNTRQVSEILFMTPVFKQMIWGGCRMKKEYGYDIPGDDTGECWAISAHQSGDCEIAQGTYKGKTLSWLWNNEHALFGDAEGDRFPLLTKIIDAKSDLSIQVHPDDAYARENENGALGKTECWYILDCDEDAAIVIGHNAQSRAELREMVYENRWSELIREIPIKKGDFFQINPGTMHAIKGGTMILETQQNSDITYRVYDYGRLSNGKPRELHLNKSIEVMTVPYVDDVLLRQDTPLRGGRNENLVCCDYYNVWKLICEEEETYEQSYPFMLCSVIEGNGSIDGHDIKRGDHFILPAGYGSFTLKGNITLIASTIAK